MSVTWYYRALYPSVVFVGEKYETVKDSDHGSAIMFGDIIIRFIVGRTDRQDREPCYE